MKRFDSSPPPDWVDAIIILKLILILIFININIIITEVLDASRLPLKILCKYSRPDGFPHKV